MSDTTALSVYVAFADLDAAQRAYDAAEAEAREVGNSMWEGQSLQYHDKRLARERFCEALDAYVDGRIALRPLI